MSSGMIFDIQRYAVHDGPGIRTILFLKGCPLACLWCCNPESQGFGPELRHVGARCRACFSCAMACPEGAVHKGPSGPLFERAKCRACLLWPCLEACERSALARVGEAISVEAAAAQIAADAAFYRNSGGGVTFSGGEPLAQPEFLGDLLERCRSLGIRTAVETCGYVPGDTLLSLAPLVDLFLYDVKVMDAAQHETLTGRSNEVILDNLRALAREARDRITLRLPLVPGCTDSDRNLAAVAELAEELRLPRVELMPYHELGKDKYAGLGREYPGRLDGPPREPDCAAARVYFLSRGIACEIIGE